MNDHSGILLSEHQYEDTWSFIRHADGKVHLRIPDMLDALRALPDQHCDEQKDYPLVLIAGERRSFNANTIFRDTLWRKAHGPLINLLTDAKHCDPISATPFHKYVPVRLVAK